MIYNRKKYIENDSWNQESSRIDLASKRGKKGFHKYKIITKNWYNKKMVTRMS